MKNIISILIICLVVIPSFSQKLFDNFNAMYSLSVNIADKSKTNHDTNLTLAHELEGYSFFSKNFCFGLHISRNQYGWDENKYAAFNIIPKIRFEKKGNDSIFPYVGVGIGGYIANGLTTTATCAEVGLKIQGFKLGGSIFYNRIFYQKRISFGYVYEF